MVSRPPLHILHTESSLGLGGQELRIVAEAQGLRARGHAVVLAVQPSSQLARLARQAGIAVEEIRMSPERLPAIIADFLRAIRHHRVDVINTHGSLDSWAASIAGRLSARKPVIVRSRHKTTPIAPSWRHRVLYRSLPHAIVTTGEAVRRHLVEEHGVPSERVVSIPTGVDVRRFVRHGHPDRSSEHGEDNEETIVGTVAFLRDYKGLDVLIAAAREIVAVHPHVKVWIIGEGPERGRLERMIDDLGLEKHVKLWGHRTEIPQWLSCMKVFVMPSTGAEGVPQALTQALAMERPVVASSVGGIPEVVEHGLTGLLVPPNDPNRLAKAVLLLLGNPVLRDRLGRAGRRRVVEEYSLTRMLEKTEELYYRLLYGHG